MIIPVHDSSDDQDPGDSDLDVYTIGALPPLKNEAALAVPIPK